MREANVRNLCAKRTVKITVEIPTAANYFLSPMEPQPKPRGFFRKGNKYGKGRPFGSRNKPKDYPFMKDGSTMVLMRCGISPLRNLLFQVGTSSPQSCCKLQRFSSERRPLTC